MDKEIRNARIRMWVAGVTAILAFAGAAVAYLNTGEGMGLPALAGLLFALSLILYLLYISCRAEYSRMRSKAPQSKKNQRETPTLLTPPPEHQPWQ